VRRGAVRSQTAGCIGLCPGELVLRPRPRSWESARWFSSAGRRGLLFGGLGSGLFINYHELAFPFRRLQFQLL